MKIAIFGASSQIAKDLVISFNLHTNYICDLFVREVARHQTWLFSLNNNSYQLKNYDQFTNFDCYDVLINFVGVGDPAKAKEVGANIFEITERFDSLSLEYLKKNPSCKYIFLSSGAVYNNNFEEPAKYETCSNIDINNLQPTDWYSIAKLHAEARHRAMSKFTIVDVRVFNYFSHTQDMNARFLITDIVRAIKNKEILKTSPVNIVRDYITPLDFYQLIQCIIGAGNLNAALDCYTQAPVEKFELLECLAKYFGLKYELSKCVGVNATGNKINYYSQNQSEIIGYVPTCSSIDGILKEIKKSIQFDS